MTDVDPGTSVRPPIRISWERSRRAHVSHDRPTPSYDSNVDADTVLLRAARPVLATLSAELADEPVTLLLTDARGVVLSRSGGDPTLIRALDAVDLSPGFSYSEDEVGTNGIGTAIEVGGAFLVDGAEHFSHDLRDFSCAGANIAHPITGTRLGVVDITTRSKHASSLLLSFAKQAAAHVQQRILTDVSALDTALLSDYYLACQRSGGGVIALGEEIFVMNTLLQQRFDATDQAAIIDLTRDSRGRRASHTTIAELPSGTTARLTYEPTFVTDALAGGIVRIREHTTRLHSSPPTRAAPSLPGVAGASAVWRRVTQHVIDSCARREWIVLEGEAGTGKSLLVRSAHEQAHRGRRIATIDAGGDHPEGHLVDLAAAELEGGADLLVRHAHRLSGEDLDGLAHLLQQVHDDDDPTGPWVAITVVSGGAGQVPAVGAGTRLLGFFPRTVDVPPLRHHLTDIPALVRHLLDVAGAPDLDLSPAALNQLMRLPWRGNVVQVTSVLDQVVHRRRSGEAGLDDLPAECRSTIRRQLSPMETVERDAIVDALALHQGDKAAASASLGVSRATIYRKIRQFGITS